jgi:peptidyl-prolyl cis-trans isomerase SurA
VTPIRVLGLLAVLPFVLLLSAARAEDVRILAVVNDEVISQADLDQRLGLVLASSNLGSDAGSRQRVAEQVLRQMIDEKLELQEAKRRDVKVPDSDVDRMYKNIEKQNNLPEGGLDHFLSDRNIEKETLMSQLRTQLTWDRAVREHFGHTINIGDEDVDDAIKQIQAGRDQVQNRVGEIFLAVNDPAEDADVRNFATQLYEQLQRGSRFDKAAQQFSQSAAAAQGGDIGWVLPGMLDPDVEQVINKLDKGQLAPPQRLGGGYYIYALIDRRTPDDDAKDVTVNLTQVVLPLAADADAKTKQEAMDRVAQLTADAKSCGEMAKIGREVSPERSGPIGDVKMKELPEELRPVIADAVVAIPTKPIQVRAGIGVFMVCKRDGGEAKIDRELIAYNLERQRQENLARRYLADLRLIAFIDRRV